MSSLSDKISTEVGVHTTADKWFNLFSKKLHHIQNIAERIHGAKLHKGDQWHTNDSVKHWSYTIVVKQQTVKSQEKIESVDEKNKSIVFKLFGEDIDNQFEVFNLIFQAIEKNDGSAAIKWSVEYKRVSEEVHPPYGYMEFCNKYVKDIDDYLVKEEDIVKNNEENTKKKEIWV